ncbi:uncharacterized protein LOC141921582 [Strix aluco]|uniref:uncharacterized protein LOC141921582 n=1 Tax=Strix aluco TaxID=111821 RepID=UPI003DA660CB
MGGHGRAPQPRPFSCPPLSAPQGGSHRRRGGAEHRRAADPGPQEEREAPSPPPGGTGHRQVATWHHPAPTAPPGPGPAVGAEQREGGSGGRQRGGGGGRQRRGQDLHHLHLAQRHLCCHFRLPGTEAAVAGQAAGDTRRSHGSPRDRCPIDQTPAEGAEPTPCRCWCRVAARRWPFPPRGCSLSAAWFLQADPKQGPPTAPSTNGGGLCHSPGQAGSGCSRALFGQPLAALCGEAGTLPRPIQELLDILHQRGPSTEGIFRRSDRGTALQKLKEDLDRGADVDLANQPVILLAALLKDFLRSIPGKLLVVGLYQDWMQAMERPSKEARVEALKVVAEKLPAAHLLLLQRLISLLQNIGHHVPTSRMTSSNLAICLGPNLLGPPDEDLLPLEAMLEVTEKVKLLVEFLIENGSDILGEEMAVQMSPEPMGRCTELPLGREHGPAGEAVAQLQAKAFLDAPASLLSLQRAAGADAVLGAEWAEAPVALSPATPATTVEALGCAEEPKSLSEQRRFAGSRQENASQRKRKREEAWAEETEPHQAKKRREEKMGTARKAGRCKRSGSPRC